MKRKRSHRTENKRIQKADAAVYVQLVMRIVPPAVVEKHFHKPRREIFQHGCDEHRRKEQLNPGVFERHQKKNHKKATAAINWADRAVQKASVYKMLFGNRTIDYFADPSDEAVYDEQ